MATHWDPWSSWGREAPANAYDYEWGVPPPRCVKKHQAARAQSTKPTNKLQTTHEEITHGQGDWEASDYQNYFTASHDESREYKSQIERLNSRVAAAEAAAETDASKLQASQDESRKYQEKSEELNCRLALAEAAVTDSASMLQASQDEVMIYKELYVKLSSRMAACENADGSNPGLQTLLENATYKERCQNLTEQLAKAEVEASAKADEIRALWTENATYKERLRQVQHRTGNTDCRGFAHFSRAAASSTIQASSDEESDTKERGYTMVEADDDAASSVLSRSSWFSVKPHCFMVQALFKTRSYGVDFFLMGKDLKKGSQVVGADDKTILEVSEAPQVLPATEVVDLQAGDAMLQVTPDHLVLVPGDGGGAEKYVAAGSLKMGDLIMLDSGEPAPLTSVTIQPRVCDVLKVVFEPDLPVAVFSCPPRILSKGHRNKKSKTRRARMCYRGRAGADQTADGGVSIPMTAGDYMD